MIPKIIHYCWFGRKPLPRSARKCIASWRTYFPDYEIKEWNEDNFDVNAIPFIEEAYRMGKYAFVSDYARFEILYREGGLYFDTDVEVIRPMDDIVAKGAFMGIEQDHVSLGVAAGLGLGAESSHPFYKEIVEYYKTINFVDNNGEQFPGTVVLHVTNLLKSKGFAEENSLQVVDGITIYPNDYFNPLDDATGRLTVTENTRSIHWYAKTWVENYGPARKWITRFLHRQFGVNSLSWIKELIHIK